MLSRLRIERVPDFQQLQMGTEIIDMPVRTLTDTAMVIGARLHPAGTEGAAAVEVIARLQR